MGNLLVSPTTVNSLDEVVDAVIAYRGTNPSQPVNGSLCVISNLEVYRGSDQVIEIESGGFSLNESGFIQVTSSKNSQAIVQYIIVNYHLVILDR